MESLSFLPVGEPLNLLGVGVLFLAAHFLVQVTGVGSGGHPRALLVVAGGWALYAAWEWPVQVRAPEANIRVDLMLIWPVLLILSIWFAIRVFR